MTHEREEIVVADIRELAIQACTALGAGMNAARSLVDATLSAALFGNENLGFPHFLDYLESFRDGRIDGHAEPQIEHPLPAMILSDARGGIAQLGFDIAYPHLVKQAKGLGVALFTQRNSYTAGELGYYVRRLVHDGLVAFAVTNGPPLMAAAPGGPRVYCTNPHAFAAPVASPASPLVIDQATSATAYVNIVRAASRKEAIPEGWAVDKDGNMTTDAEEALGGALLPFGGYKGANLALLAEVLSAGLSGSTWSIDANDFRSGHQSPHAGLTVIAISPDAVTPDFVERNTAQLQRLRGLGVYIPGARAATATQSEPHLVNIKRSDLEAIRSFAASGLPR